MKCAEVCTSGCISYDDNELVIAPEKCIGCGTCATICPTCALEAHRPDDAELLQSCLSACAQADGEVIIACEQLLSAAEGLYDPEKVVGVACLGRVEESLLVSLAAQDAAHVSLVRAKCASCAHAVGHDTAVVRMRNGEHAAGNLEQPPAREHRGQASVPRAPGAGQGLRRGRRGFFATMKGEAKNAAVTTADYAVKDALGVEEQQAPKYVKVTKDGTLPHLVPHRRERLLDALAALGEPQDVMIDTRLWGHVVIEADECLFVPDVRDVLPDRRHREVQGGGRHVRRGASPERMREVPLLHRHLPRGRTVAVRRGVRRRPAVECRGALRDGAPKNPPGNPHQIYRSMKDLIGIDQVYER